MFPEVVAPLLTTEWGRRTGWALALFFSLCLIFTVFTFPFDWYDDYELAHQALPKPVLSASNPTLALIKQLPSKHLFGDASNQAAIPITSLQLRLVGVIKGDSDQSSKVIISEAGQTGKVYRIGDTLSSGVKVSGITTDGVVLNNGGHLEKLPLPRSPLIFQEMSKESLLGD